MTFKVSIHFCDFMTYLLFYLFIHVMLGTKRDELDLYLTK